MTSESSLEAFLAVLRASRAAGRYQELLAKAELAMALIEGLFSDALPAPIKDAIIMVVADNGAIAARQLRDRERLRYFTDEIVAVGRRLGGSALAHGLGWRALGHELDGSLAAAAADYAEALALLRDVKDPAPNIEQIVRINYAELLYTRGEHESARAVLKVGGSPSDWTDVFPSQSGQAHEHALYAAASFATMTADIDQLTRLKLDALALGDKRGAGVIASNIGTTLFNDGQPAAAIPHLVEARDLLRVAEADECLAVTCMNLGLAHAALQGPEAIDCLKEAWAVIRVVAPRSPKALRVLYALARQRFLGSDFARAKAALDRGIGVYEAVRPEIAVGEAEHEDTLRTYRLMLELRIILAMEDRWIDQAVDLIERGKARLWSEFLAVRAVAGPGTAVEGDRSPKAALITGPKSVMLNYFVGPHATFVAYNRPGRPGVRRIDIPEDYLRDLVARMTSEMLLWQSRSGSTNPLRSVLGMVLLEKLDLSRAQAVFVLPDGPLWDVPFDAMPIPGRTDYLGEAVPIVVAPALRVLGQIQRRAAPPLVVSEWRMVALGDPAAGSGYDPIPGTGRQVEMLRSVVPTTIPLVRWDANRHELLKHTATASHIHLAAHAEARQVGDEPHIVLSDGRNGPDRLYAGEIAQLTLRAELVFLSACGTSAGRASTGEGLTSVARAFILAGARCVVAAAWPIPDEDAELLVRDFYGALLTGTAVARAARTARLAAREAGADIRVWAALQVLGDGLANDDQLQLLVDEEA